MHALLERQLMSVFASLENAPAGIAPFLALLDRHYHEWDLARDASEKALADLRAELVHRQRELGEQRARREAQERESEARFHAFMDNTPMICALKDASGILLYANRTCERHFPHLPALGGGMSFAWLPPEIAGTREEDAAVLSGAEATEAVRAVEMPGDTERHWLIYRFRVPVAKDRALVGVSALDITERRRVEDALRRQALILETIHDAVVVTDLMGRITSCNTAATALTGLERSEMIGQPLGGWHDQAPGLPTLREMLAAVVAAGRWSGDIPFRRKDGGGGECETVIVPLRDERGRAVGFIAVSRDISERRAMARQLLQAQKLEAIGQLAAGIAHEINTPNQYVADNVHFLEGAFRDLFGVLDENNRLLEAARAYPELAEPVAGAEEASRAVDVGFLATEVPTAIRQSRDGLRRIAEIVNGVKAFAHPGGGSKTDVDLNAALENVIQVSRNEWKYVAEVETSFDPTLPPVPCFAGEIDQVFLNILVNAAHAIADVVAGTTGARGCITVSTRCDGGHAEVRIADTGPGIPAEVQSRVFDPFFTTKTVGQGTGQGLAISHRLVVDRHGGTLGFETAAGRGTVFVIRLPLDGAASGAAQPRPPTTDSEERNAA